MRHPHRSAGIIAVWVVLMIMVLIGFLGLVCDLAYVFLVGQQLQATADAAALGGAAYVHLGQFDQVHSQAKMVALGNRASGNSVSLFDGDVEVGRYYQKTDTFVPTEVGADAVRVVARRPDAAGNAAPLFWGPLFGTKVAQGGREAVAVNLGGPGAGILVLDPNAKRALRLGGNAGQDDGEPVIKISIDNGRLHVNSTNKEAIKTEGNPTIEIPDISVSASYDPPYDDVIGGNLIGNFWPNAPYVSDPLAFLQAWMDNVYLVENPISQMKMTPLTAAAGVPLKPGYYPGGIDLQGDIILEPGGEPPIYILDGEGKDQSATGGLQIHGTLVGHGVYIYVLGGQIDLTGATQVDLSAVPMGPGAPVYAGVVIHQAPANTNEAKITGTENMRIQGTLYFPKAQLTLGGNCDYMANQIIVNTLRIDGKATLHIHYDGRFGGSGKVFLVQ